jgi:L-fuculose-phosphate aldolase
MNLREELVWAGNELLRRGLTVYTAGNVSVRTEDGLGFYIKPSSVPYPDIRPEDVVCMDWAGEILSGTRRPSVEHNLHRLLYLARPNISAVVHTHSQYATTLACSKMRCGIPPVLGEVPGYLKGAIDLAEYAPSGTKELAQKAVECLGQKRFGILLKNHGALAVGVGLRQALDFSQIIEKCAESFILAQLIGGYDLDPASYRREGESVPEASSEPSGGLSRTLSRTTGTGAH